MKSSLLGLFVLCAAGIANADPDILKQAEAAYVDGQYANSIELAQKGMADDSLRAWRILGANYCMLKDKTKAQEALTKLDAPGQKYLRYVCKRQTITLD